MWIVHSNKNRPMGIKMRPAMVGGKAESGIGGVRARVHEASVIASPEQACRHPQGHLDNEPNEGPANLLQGIVVYI